MSKTYKTAITLAINAVKALIDENFENAENIANEIYAITRQPGTIFAE